MVRLLALLVAAVLTMSACGGGGQSAGTDDSPGEADATAATEEGEEAAAADLPDEIVVPGTLAMTGPFVVSVKDFDKLGEAFAADVNADGGLDMCGTKVPLRFEWADDGSDPAQARRLYEEFARDEPPLFIGPHSSPVSFAVAPVAETAKIPMVMTEASSDAIYSQGFEWVFGVLAPGPTWSDNLFKTLTALPEPPQKIAFILEDNLSNREIFEGAKANAEKAGMEIVAEEILHSDTKDFTPAIANLQKGNPDVIHVSSFEAFGVVFLRQALEQGLDPKLFHLAKYGAPVQEALGDQANGVSGEHYWLPGVPGEGTDRFEKILDESGLSVDVQPWTAIHMASFQVIEKAFETACSTDPAVLQETLQSLTTPSIGGDITFAENGAGTLKPFPTQIQEGEFRIVGPPDIAETEFAYPYEY